MESRALVTLYGFDQDRDISSVHYQLINADSEVIRLTEQNQYETRGQIRNRISRVERPMIQFWIFLYNEEVNAVFDEVRGISVRLKDRANLMSDPSIIPVIQ